MGAEIGGEEPLFTDFAGSNIGTQPIRRCHFMAKNTIDIAQPPS
jgi:hypothetical protein